MLSRSKVAPAVGVATMSFPAKSLAVSSETCAMPSPAFIVYASVWRVALSRVITSETEAQELADRGYERSKLFRWDTTANATVDVYRKLL